MHYSEYISINPSIRFGKPCITGTRISVYDVLGWLSSGMTTNDIKVDFPQLNSDQIFACMAYAADKERKVILSD